MMYMYVPAPNQNTSRMLSALHIQMHLKCKPFDISLAYHWADLPPGKLIALKINIPRGMSTKALMVKAYIWSCESAVMATLQLARHGQNIVMNL